MNVFLVGASLQQISFLNALCASTVEPVFKQFSTIFVFCFNGHNSVSVFSNDLKQKLYLHYIYIYT